MANPLTDPNDWADQEASTPPSQWDGVAYEWFGVFGAGQPAQYIDFTGDVGSVPASFSVSVSTGVETFSIPHVLRVVFNGDVIEDRPLTPETTEEFSFTTPATVTSIRVLIMSNGEEYAYAYSMDVAVTPIAQDDVVCNFNCECEDEYPTRTLAQMREFMMIRLGWAAMKDTPLPGVVDTLNSFLQDAQEQLHAEYRLPRLERFFTWDLLEGVRFYDLIDNADVCTKELDPRQLTWIGISDGCDAWRKLVCGIPPESYYDGVSGIPTRYEIRQCIEVWPAPGGDNWKLRIKGYFYNEALTADTDVASLDYQAVQLFALANAKAHYGQQDAPNVMRQAMRYIGNMTAGAHHTRRYVPGTKEWTAPPLPVLTGYPGDP